MCLHAIHSMRCYLLQGVVREMTRYSARQALLWQLIGKNRKRRLVLHTALNTLYQRRQLLLQVSSIYI